MEKQIRLQARRGYTVFFLVLFLILCSRRDEGTAPHDGSGSAGGNSQLEQSWTRRASGAKWEFNGVTYGSNKFVAVGYGYTILTSQDGISWTTRMSGTEGELFGVTYGNGLFVAVGSNGTILTSP